MTDQDFLFGNTEVVGDDVARREFRLLSWNMASPSLERARRQVDWLYETERNVIVMTEVKIGDGSRHLTKELESSGFTVTQPRTGPDDRYVTLVATKGFQVRSVPLSFETPRLVAARLTTHFGDLDVIGLYSLTNGMSAESSQNRKAFQEQVVQALRLRLTGEPDVPVLMTGDYNILEPGHQPPCSLFEEHDYEFYRSLIALGLIDGYRRVQPDGRDLTWYGPQGGQLLDYALMSPRAAARLTECGFDDHARSSGLSDHAALVLTAR
ncbi:endonuclease/exonuclease/phosphatase family protein [Streptomyces sp. NBC_00102]|uniref:endonuclease/exonuclease/phosphatase family protein n=1 Tax=Streptomyces sp. NBC_00102 TaxID=2975652 RepID=UPI002258B1D0|nr:endonuclease/exonuclease/phosphatase family protein [Streptomyces sp. NBC_00102]MCX5402279.1 endonuclease/exonuclease/phosphatase family protein [Streptomyces sp. NBC_00102]